MAPEVRIGDVNGTELLAYSPARGTHGWANSSNTTSAYQYGSRIGFLGDPATDPLIPGQQYFARIGLDGDGTTDCFNRDLFVIAIP